MSFIQNMMKGIVEKDSSPDKDELKLVIELARAGKPVPIENIIKAIKAKDVSLIITVGNEKVLEDEELKESFNELVEEIKARVKEVNSEIKFMFSYATLTTKVPVSPAHSKFIFIKDKDNDSPPVKILFADVVLSIDSKGTYHLDRCISLPTGINFI